MQPANRYLVAFFVAPWYRFLAVESLYVHIHTLCMYVHYRDRDVSASFSVTASEHVRGYVTFQRQIRTILGNLLLLSVVTPISVSVSFCLSVISFRQTCFRWRLTHVIGAVIPRSSAIDAAGTFARGPLRLWSLWEFRIVGSVTVIGLLLFFWIFIIKPRNNSISEMQRWRVVYGSKESIALNEDCPTSKRYLVIFQFIGNFTILDSCGLLGRAPQCKPLLVQMFINAQPSRHTMSL